MPLAFLLPPAAHGIRGPDSYARDGGGYGANRTHGETNGGKVVEVNEPHRGIDFIVDPDRNPLEPIACPCECEVIRMGFAYQRDERFRLCVLMVRADPNYTIKLLYVGNKDSLPGERYERGDAIGLPQDLRLRYPADDAHAAAITPHCHLELRYRGQVIDPTPFLIPLGPRPAPDSAASRPAGSDDGAGAGGQA